MSSVISNADQNACRPWEIASFEGDPHAGRQSKYAGITLPTIEQISAIQEQARQEGYQAGHAEGHAEGYKHGQQKAALETTRLRNLAKAFTNEISHAGENI